MEECEGYSGTNGKAVFKKTHDLLAEHTSADRDKDKGCSRAESV
jgi:hypothetical protein